jgi:hypothetical protein
MRFLREYELGPFPGSSPFTWGKEPLFSQLHNPLVRCRLTDTELMSDRSDRWPATSIRLHENFFGKPDFFIF